MRKVVLALGLVIAACGGKSAPPPPPTGGGDTSGETGGATPPGGPSPTAGGDCIKSGCSGTVCTEPGNDVMTTCEFKPEYACYREAACERQADGKCAWTKSAELDACLANPPAM